MAKKIRFAPIKTAAVHTFSNSVPHRPSLYNPPALPVQRLVTLLSAIGVRAFSCARTPLVTLLQIRGNLFPLSPAFLPPALARSAPDPPVPSPRFGFLSARLDRLPPGRCIGSGYGASCLKIELVGYFLRDHESLTIG